MLQDVGLEPEKDHETEEEEAGGIETFLLWIGRKEQPYGDRTTSI